MITIRELKEKLNSLDESHLNKNVGFKSQYESGFVDTFVIQDEDLYWLGDDDPSELYTKNQLLEMNYDEEEIDTMLIEIHKGDPIFIWE